jgi:hypothetical protein
MIHRVDAQQCVEGVVIEWQRARRIRHHEFQTLRETRTGCRTVGGLHATRIGVQTRHATTRLPGEVQCRTPGAAGNLYYMGLVAEAQRLDEAFVFVGRDPAVLADVLAERRRTHRRQHLFGEVCVGVVKEVYTRGHFKPTD